MPPEKKKAFDLLSNHSHLFHSWLNTSLLFCFQVAIVTRSRRALLSVGVNLTVHSKENEHTQSKLYIFEVIIQRSDWYCFFVFFAVNFFFVVSIHTNISILSWYNLFNSNKYMRGCPRRDILFIYLICYNWKTDDKLCLWWNSNSIRSCLIVSAPSCSPQMNPLVGSRGAGGAPVMVLSNTSVFTATKLKWVTVLCHLLCGIDMLWCWSSLMCLTPLRRFLLSRLILCAHQLWELSNYMTAVACNCVEFRSFICGWSCRSASLNLGSCVMSLYVFFFGACGPQRSMWCLHHTFTLCLVPCTIHSCPQALWEAVSSEDGKLFQPYYWLNIYSGLNVYSAIILDPPHTH